MKQGTWILGVGLIAVGLLLASCTSSGLSAAGKGKDEAIDNEAIDAEECATLCLAAIEDPLLMASGCLQSCGVAAGEDFGGSAAVAVFPIIWAGADFEIEGEVSCELVFGCPEQSDCQRGLGLCLGASAVAGADGPDSCFDEYESCFRDTDCSLAFESCNGEAQKIYEDCMELKPGRHCVNTRKRAKDACVSNRADCLESS